MSRTSNATPQANVAGEQPEPWEIKPLGADRRSQR